MKTKLNKYQIAGIFLILIAAFLTFSIIQPNGGSGDFKTPLGNNPVGGCNANLDSAFALKASGSATKTTSDSCGNPGTGGSSGCSNDQDCLPGWGCYKEPNGNGVCQSAYGGDKPDGGNPSGLCATSAECGGCQDCGSDGKCAWRCDSNSCHFHGNTGSGSCPGEAGY